LLEPKINSPITRMMSSSGAPISTIPRRQTSHDPVAAPAVAGRWRAVPRSVPAHPPDRLAPRTS
jgi:hypothetical protein